MKSPQNKPKWIPRWKATDSDGKQFYFSHKPTLIFGIWMPCGGYLKFVGKVTRPADYSSLLKPLFLEI